jgi:hypothetical protein
MPRTIQALTPDLATAFFRRFCGEEKIRRYVFGINEYAESVAKICNIDGFIDDFSKAATHMGKPVCKLGSIAPDSLVVSCVTASYPVSALDNLQKAGIRNFADYFALADASGGRLPQVMPCRDPRRLPRAYANTSGCASVSAKSRHGRYLIVL